MDKQKIEAKMNFNYFLIILIVKICKVILLLATILLIDQVFDTLIINIITLIFVITSFFIVYKIIGKYNYILNDIKNTFNSEDFYLTVNTDVINNKKINGVVKYGK